MSARYPHGNGLCGSPGDEAQDRSLQDRIRLEAGLLQRKGGKQQGGITPRAGDRRFAPLSYAQERMWFMDQMSPDVPLYNVACATRLTGAFNSDALYAALHRLV